MSEDVRPRRVRSIAVAVVGLGTALALTAMPGAGTATATAPAVVAVDASVDTVKKHVVSADDAIGRAIQKLEAHRYVRARNQLATARIHIKKANAQAASLIGAPPTDPESDELPGPPAVVAALKLDNRVTTRLVPLFDGLRRTRVLDALRYTVGVAQGRRATVLKQVFALPRAGGDDYADGMADTLPIYAHEVEAISHALDAFSLAPTARTALTTALAKAREAKADMNAAYGGGERAAA